MGDWTSATLGAIASQDGYGLVDGPFGSNLPASSYQASGVPVIRGSNLTVGLSRFRTDEFVFVSKETAQQLARSLCRPLDIVFTKKGTLGQTGLVPEHGPYDLYLLSSNQMKLTVDRSLAEPLYVYYAVSSPESVQKILQDSEATGVPKTNITYLREFPIRLPPLLEQRAIAQILSALDDKIDLNRRMNETLEQTARALFKDWFVDFGPTKAKMEGREAYLEADLWALFPERLDEKGKPEGWQNLRLDQIAMHYKNTITPMNTPEQVFEHYSLPAFDSGQEPVVDLGASIKSNKTLVPEGSILLSKLNPEIQRVWMPHAPVGTVQVASTEFLAFLPKPQVGRSLLFCLFSDVSFRQVLQGMVTGTSKSHQRVSPPALLALAVVRGSPRIFQAFEETVSLLLDRVLANRLESRSLAQTRDLLLPKLMSGELRVRDAESVVSEVV